MLLEGYRVLDLTQGRPPGATCTHMLADLGMEVIRVDLAEGEGAGFLHGGRDLAFDSANRNKRSIAINLKTDEGKKIFYKLVASADAVLEGARPGSAKRLGVDYDTLKQINKKLVYCSISAFGQDGPYALVGAHDTEAAAMRGAFGHTDGSVMTPSYFGVLIALADAVSTFNLGKLQSVLTTGKSYVTSHMDRAFLKCKDGKFIAQANVEPHNWARFCEAVGLPGLLGLPKADPQTRERMIEELRATMLTKTRDEWFDVISKSGATVAACKELEELPDDPQIKHRGMIWELDHPTEGKVRQWGFPILVKGEEAGVRTYAPAVGADTLTILGELGYSHEETEAFRAAGAVNR